MIIHRKKESGPPDLLKLECANCGAPLTYVDNTHAVCSYCGQEFLIDEVKGPVVDVHVDYGNSDGMRRAVESTRTALIVFLVVAVLVVAVILGFHIAAEKSVLFSSDKDIPADNSGDLLATFCEDIFGKEYGEITPEEFDSIRYLRCGYEREGSELFNAVWYSFTDYRECAGEEEFQETVKSWHYRTRQVSWPSDYTAFTGLTRIDTRDTVWLSMLEFSPESRITCVDTDDGLDTVTEIADPAQIEILHIGIMGKSLDQIGLYKNLRELSVDTTLDSGTVDVSGLAACTNLESLSLDCAEHYTGLEKLGGLTRLRELSLSGVNIRDCSFLKELTQLQELSVCAGEDPDLSVLTFLPELKSLVFTDGKAVPLQEFSFLQEAGKLTGLTIAVGEKECLTALSGMGNLTSLDLSVSFHEYRDNRQVPLDVSALAALTKLESLALDSFWGGEVTGLEAVLNLPGLKVFRLGKSVGSGLEPILDVTALADRPAIEEFGMESCHPKDAATGEELDFGFLARYPGIKRLYLDGCGMTDAAFLSFLPELRRLSLWKNKITDFSPLSECRKLEDIRVEEDAAGSLPVSGEVGIYVWPDELPGL